MGRTPVAPACALAAHTNGGQNTTPYGTLLDMDVAIAGTVGAVVGILLTALSTYVTERASAKRSVKQALTEARREAYGRYLVAQEALHLSIKREIRIEEDAVLDRLEEGHESRARGLYAESSSAEMQARLLCGDAVRLAIDTFEKYVVKATRAAEGKNTGESLAEKEWDRNRDDLIRKMYEEIFPGLGQNGD